MVGVYMAYPNIATPVLTQCCDDGSAKIVAEAKLQHQFHDLQPALY